MCYKQIFRELAAHKARYIILIVILAMSLTLAGGNIMSSNSIKDDVDSYFEEYNAQDGEFKTFFALDDKIIGELGTKGVQIEEKFYADYNYGSDADIRVYKVRNEISRINVTEGVLPANAGEVLLERKFAKANSVSVGDTIEAAGINLTVSGLGTVPDYISVKKNMSDLKPDDADFGLLFVTSEGYDKLFATGRSIHNEVYEYSYKLHGGMTDDELKKYLNDVAVPEEFVASSIDSMLISITPTDDNERMSAYKADLDTTLSVSIFMAILLAILIAFIISVFMTHTIDEQSAEIGTLYAMGVRRREMMRQYVLLPTAVILIGGIIGTVCGYLMCGISVDNSAVNYSYPDISSKFYPVSILFGIVLPAVFGFAVNWLIIRHKLNSQPLDLLRKTRKNVKPSRVKIKRGSFNRIYRIRQLLREKVVYIVLFVGCFYSLCILVFAFTMFSGLNNYTENCTGDVKWSYMYSLNSMPESVPENAEKAVVKTVASNNVYSGKDHDLTLIGVNSESRYFDLCGECSENEVIISDCAARKFDWSEGDSVELINKKDDSKSSFKVKRIVDYYASLLIFMPEKNVRSIYGFSDGFFNTLLSDEKLESLDVRYVQSVTKRDDIQKAADNLLESMWSTIWVSLGGAVVVFIAVLYLLLKHVIDKSSFALSLMRIFGYRDREVNRIFVDSNLLIVGVAALLAVIVGKPVIDGFYPTLITDIELGLDFTFKPVIYVIIAAVIILSYFASTYLLKRKLRKADFTEVLKERD